MNKIFITGASGFIGSNLVKKLVVNNQVYTLFRKTDKEINEKTTIVFGDILSPESFISNVNGCDILFHCAAYISFQEGNFQKAYKVNVEGTRNVLEAAYQAKVKKVVHLSACAVLGYSKDENQIIDETAKPKIPKSNVYAYTKMKAEEVVQEYVKKGANISIANIATVYGAGDRRLNSGSIIKAIYENKIKFAPPGGTSYVTVNDLIDGLILLAQKGRPGERYIFCNENLTFFELFNRIATVLGKGGIKFILPRWTYLPANVAAFLKDKLTFRKRGFNLITPQIIKESYNYKYYSSQKARESLGWSPKETLEEAVTEAFKYYLKEGLICNGR
ncbi:MAG: NAD-dependent epimerase/dehydratase family protein [Candidatus Omnitrophota bacterium]|nr:NAD-dependent epimerase/dehydratase family protein [Candidatus Omnitrophota bacterium]